jgi:hypothetical protein
LHHYAEGDLFFVYLKNGYGKLLLNSLHRLWGDRGI